MNERIRKLAKQTGYIWHASGDLRIYEFTPEKLEKFAELIVRECIQNIRDNMEIAKVDTLGDKDLFLETLRKSGHFYITELEQHFGLEE
jgi:hypothetical protein